ncbi:3-hydroxyisobutyrate dehydrogenase [Penicillium alfredii]|uniref:3-hydroxyisobutyrate dehydrogenase n=1 Tax=Penicillium alfredii TaxID=1506179 RepID=A0A9W9FQU6_9EURO|nr:3-hydroxyisobutyrate dehydrogenase [Penicillium alfredii]KAJ5104695.1 3-hydroxyisobutyrate dehydrogenase [Penicillium alfredii]
MGQAMALNLQKHLHRSGAPSLRFYNRTLARGLALGKIGGEQKTSVEDVISHSDICFISVSDDEALTAIITSILGAVTANNLGQKIIVDTSTVHPDTSRWAQRTLKEEDVSFVAAPVFGASPVAEKGELLFVVAGEEEHVETIQPFLVGVMARKVLRLRDDVGQATMLKTAGNFLTAGMMELVAEAQVFAEKTGIGSESMESLLKEQYGPLPLAMSKRMTGGFYLPKRGERPWSDLQLAQKDVNMGISCARAAGTALPVAEVVSKHLDEAHKYSEVNHRASDSSSMYGVLRKNAGLRFESDQVLEREGEV